MKKYFFIALFIFSVQEMFAQCSYCDFTVNASLGNQVHFSHNINATCYWGVSAAQVNWGDGTITNFSLSGDHYYCVNGTYTITFTVWYSSGLINCTSTHLVTVSNNNVSGSIWHSPVYNNNVNFSSSYTSTGLTYASNYQWDFGDGNTLNTSNNSCSHTYLSIGTFFPTVTRSYSGGSITGGCTISLTVTDTVDVVCLPIYQTDDQTVCSGGNFTYPDGSSSSNLLSDTTHSSTFTTSLGCDSIITTNIHVVPNYYQTYNTVLCSGSDYTFPDGTLASGIITDTNHVSNLISISGCDSILSTNIQVVPNYYQVEPIILCNGSNYTFPDSTIATGIFNDTNHVSNLISISGCDSIITTNIHVAPNYYLLDTIVLCSGSNYTFPDGTIFQAIITDTSYASSFLSTSSCDSIIETVLTISTLDTSVTMVGNQLTANGQSLNYQWYDCSNSNLLIGDTNKIFITSFNGLFSVIVNDGFCWDTSSCYEVFGVYLSDFQNENEVLIYPNPTNSILTLEFQNPNNIIEEAKLYNTLGELLSKQKVQSNSKVYFDLSQLSTGLYYISYGDQIRKVMRE